MTKPTSKQKQGVAPRDATFTQLCRVRRDNFSTPTAWILADGFRVAIGKQRKGEQAEAMVTLPRRTFNALLKWYTKEQPFVRKK